MSSTAKKPSPRTRRSTSTSTTSASQPQKTEITINIYDLLPPGRLSNLLWTFGGSLLHSGVVVNSREYAYGGHNQPRLTGVYYTKPHFLPPGGTHRQTLLQGSTISSQTEIDETVKRVSDEFMGTAYNLLTNNCNHFTNALCVALTGRSAPNWLNRAASIGVALPCVVPREWISPPDVDTAEGELVADADGEEDEDGYEDDERSGMLARERRRARMRAAEQPSSTSKKLTSEGQREQREQGLVNAEDEEFGASLAGGKRIRDESRSPPPRLVSRIDAVGRPLPPAERAPVPKTTTLSTK